MVTHMIMKRKKNYLEHKIEVIIVHYYSVDPPPYVESG